jgi:hypothetical protein
LRRETNERAFTEATRSPNPADHSVLGDGGYCPISWRYQLSATDRKKWHTNPIAHGNAYLNKHAHTDRHEHSHPIRDSDEYADSDKDADGYTHGNANEHVTTDCYQYPHSLSHL